MEIIRTKTFVVLTEVIFSLLPGCCLPLLSLFFSCKVISPIHFFTNVHLYLCSYFFLSPFLHSLPPFLRPPLPLSLPFPYVALIVLRKPVPLRTELKWNSTALLCLLPLEGLGMKHRQEIWDIWKATGLVDKTPNKELKVPGFKSQFCLLAI